MSAPNWQGAESFAFRQLEAHLAPTLRYHTLAHSRDEVLPAACQLALLEGLDSCEIALLRVAAAYHDVGFTQRPEEHEETGARMVRQSLPQYGFGSEDIGRVVAMIMATRLPQQPRTLAEQILADADLDVLGRPNFFEKNADLRAEMAALGQVQTDPAWYRQQRDFLGRHRYFTRSARILRDDLKGGNLTHLEELLKVCTEGLT